MKGNRRILLIAEWQVGNLVQGVVKYARTHNWHLVFWHAGDVRETLCNWSGDGIIANLGYRNLLTHENISDPRMKLVSCVPLKYRSLPYSLVREDDVAIGRLAADFFIRYGYRNFAVYSHSLRGEAFRQTLAERGFGSCAHLATYSAPNTLSAWLRKLPKPCAVLAENDWDASDVINLAMLNHISIPDELAILGVGNDTNVCQASSIGLSSIDSRLEHLGYSAGAELDRLIDGGAPNSHGIAIEPAATPVERQSVNFALVGETRLGEIIDFMESKLNENLSIHGLATQFSLSDSSLYKLFVAHYHASPKQVLLQLRMRHAQNLLRDGKLTINEIVNTIGFSTPTAFFKAFREQFDCTPKQWRKQNLF
jgi:LacI family transcriptional regulator